MNSALEAQKFLNSIKSTTTIDDMINSIKSMIDSFAESRENFYIEDCLDEMSTDNQKMSESQALKFSETIAKRVQNDVKKYVNCYTTEVTDEILDLLNSKRVSKKKAYVALTVLSGTKAAFSTEDV
jgi:hypothetical protein